MIYIGNFLYLSNQEKNQTDQTGDAPDVKKEDTAGTK